MWKIRCKTVHHASFSNLPPTPWKCKLEPFNVDFSIALPHSHHCLKLWQEIIFAFGDNKFLLALLTPTDSNDVYCRHYVRERVPAKNNCMSIFGWNLNTSIFLPCCFFFQLRQKIECVLPWERIVVVSVAVDKIENIHCRIFTLNVFFMRLFDFFVQLPRICIENYNVFQACCATSSKARKKNPIAFCNKINWFFIRLAQKSYGWYGFRFCVQAQRCIYCYLYFSQRNKYICSFS